MGTTAKQEFLNGEVKDYASDDHVATSGAMKDHSGKTIFYITFNGKMIYSGKTFSYFFKKWCDLVNECNLEPVE